MKKQQEKSGKDARKMLEFKQALSKLHISEIFRGYQKKNANSYLTNSLYIHEWQINYFSPRTHLITSFIINNRIKKKNLEAGNQKFQKLNSVKITVDINAALSISKVSGTEEITIIIIQTENSIPVWNISIPTPSLKVINVKVSAETGKVLERSEKNIIETR